MKNNSTGLGTNWDALNTLLLLDELGNTSAVASELGLTSSRAVDERIQTLARKLNVVLRDRNGLTEDGRALADLARRHRALLEADLRRFIERGLIRIATTSHLSRNYFPQILKRYSLVPEHRSLQVTDRLARDLGPMVENEEVDLAIGPMDVGRPWKVQHGQTFEPCFVLLVPKRLKKELNQGPKRAWQALLEMPWVIHEGGTATRDVLEQLLKAVCGGIDGLPKLNVYVEATDAMLLVDLVRKGEGITFVGHGPAIEEMVEGSGGEVLAVAVPPTLQASSIPMEALPPCRVPVALLWNVRHGQDLPEHLELFKQATETELAWVHKAFTTFYPNRKRS